MEKAECCVCLEVFDNGERAPRILGCGHTICHYCALHLFQGQQQSLRCPECFHVTLSVHPSSLPKNIELLRLTGRNDPRPPSVPSSSSSQAGGTGRFVRNIVSSLPGSLSIHIVSHSSEKLLSFGELDDGQRLHPVSLFLLVGSKRNDFLDDGDECAEQTLWQGLPRSSRKELLELLRIASLCHAVCRVLGVWSSKLGQLYLVNKIPFRPTDLRAYLEQEKRQACLVDVAVDLCEIMTELHSQGMVLGIFGMDAFQVSEFGRARLHWNGLLELRRVMHQGLVTGDDASCAGDAWQFTSPEMLKALAARGAPSVVINGSSDVWSLACFLVHVIFKLPSTALSFQQACHDVEKRMEEKRSLLLGQDNILFRDFLWKCLVVNPDERPPMKELWHHVKRLSSSDLTLLDDNEVYTGASSPTIICFGLQGLDTTREGEVQHEKVEEEQVTPESWELQEVATLEGHTSSITCLAVCGTTLVSVSFDRTVRLWSLKDGSLLWTWEGEHPQRILALVADETSQVCYTGDYGGQICAWKVSRPFQNGPIAIWQEHCEWRYTGVSSLAISNDEVLYSGSGDMSIKAWCTQTHKLVGTFHGHRALVSALAASGGQLYSGSWDGCIRIWSRADFTCIGVLGTSALPIRALLVSSSNNVIVSGVDNGCVQFWKNGHCKFSLEVHNGPVSCCATFSGNDYLFTGSWDKSLKVLDMTTGIKDDNSNLFQTIACEDAVMSIVSSGTKLYAATGASIKVYKSFEVPSPAPSA